MSNHTVSPRPRFEIFAHPAVNSPPGRARDSLVFFWYRSLPASFRNLHKRRLP
jgi:hypothetical protein